MKNLCLTTLFLILSTLSFSQNTESVESSVYGIQIGLLGVSGYNETKLSNSIALRSELGLEMGFNISNNPYGDDVKFILIPQIRIEPRWYYNLNKRVDKGHSISKNSGNFLTLSMNYLPNLFTIDNLDYDVEVAEAISFIPKWGIKRTYGKHFTFETGIGVGYIRYLNNQVINKNEIGVDLHLRFGYTF